MRHERLKPIARALGGRKVGGGWIARCPAHDDRDPSLSIHDGAGGKLLVHCHAGCDQVQVIEALRTRGLWSDRQGPPGQVITLPRPVSTVSASAIAMMPSGREAAIAHLARGRARRQTRWSRSICGSRGIALPTPRELRFHAALRHPSGGVWPAMVALVTRAPEGEPFAIHRTFLSRDGKGKAPIEPQKMMLGPCRGGAVRLAPATATADGRRRHRDLPRRYAGGRAAGLGGAVDIRACARSVCLPRCARWSCSQTATTPGEAAAREAALRWKRQGRRVRIARPPHGFDFNDLLLGRAPRHEEGAA